MALAVFDLNDQGGFSAVVVARDGDHALEVGGQHHASIRTGGSSPLTWVERLPPLSGAARDHHLAAIQAGIVGIAHRQRNGRWLVLPPGVRALHTSKPAPTQMKHFIDDDGYEVVLFARDQERAGELYDAIRPNYRVLPREWRGSEIEAWSTYGLVRHHAQAEARGVEGVGIYNPDGWLILPLDYAVLGVEPPD